MNEQNNSTPNTSSPGLFPAKRKRGRPRKDGSVVKKGEESLQTPTTPVSDGMRTIQQNDAKPNDRSMVGRIVSGVIDGCFDAGYFLSVRMGNNGPPLRGVIFEPGRVTPLSSDNDIAPNAKLYQRSELPIPLPHPQNEGNGISPQLEMQQHNVCSQVLQPKLQSSGSFIFDRQTSCTNVPVVHVPMNNSSSSLVEKIVMQQNPIFNYLNHTQPTLPAQNLRMVEQDEMMQVYEVSVQSEAQMEDAVSAKDWISESSAKLNQHVGVSPEQFSTMHNDKENFVANEHQSIAQETPTSSSEVKHNHLPCNELKGSCHDFLQVSGIAEDQPLREEALLMDRRFQSREMVQNESQVRNLELHETPIIDQTPSAPLANQNVELELQQTPINGPNPELHLTPAVEKLPSLPTNPEIMGSELESSKFGHYDLERQNFGILRDLMAGNHHYVPPEVISDHPGKFMMQKPNSPKSNAEKGTHSDPKATVLGNNNESSDSREPISDPADINELH